MCFFLVEKSWGSELCGVLKCVFCCFLWRLGIFGFDP